MRKTLLGFGNKEIGMTTNIVLITSTDWFFTTENPSIFKDVS